MLGIKKLCIAHSLSHSKFEELSKGFKVTLYKNTIQEIASQKRVSENAMKQHLATLKKEGVLQRKGSIKTGYWEILK